MAEVKTIKIDVDTKQAVNAMENLSKATNDVNKSFEEVYGDLQPLTTRMGEAEDRLYELANAGQTASQEYQDLLETVGRYRKVQIQTDMAVDAAATTMTQKLGGALGGVTAGFELGQGVMGAFGAESEQLEKALLKVQSAMAISQGLQGFKEAIPSFTALKNTAVGAFQGMTTASKVFMVSGIGLLITAVGVLIANYDSWFSTSEKVLANQKAIEEQSKKQREAIAKESGEFSTLISRLKQTNQGSKEREELIKKVNGQYGTTLKNLKDEAAYQNQLNIELASYLEYQKAKFSLQKNEELITKNLEKQMSAKDKINKLEAENTKLIKEGALEKEKGVKVDARTGAVTETGKLVYKNIELAASYNANKEEIEKLNKQLKAAEERFENYGEAANKAQSKVDKITEGGKKFVEQTKELVKEQEFVFTGNVEAFNAAAYDIDVIDEHFYDEMKARDAADIERIMADNQLKIDANADLQQALTDAALERIRIEDEAEAEKQRKFKENLKTSVQLSIQGLKLIASIAEFNAGEDKKRQKTAFNIKKAANIASATMDGYNAVLSTFADTKGGVVLKSIAASIAGGFAALQIAGIAKQQFNGGESTSGGFNGSTGSTGGGVMSPNFNIVGNSGFNQLAQIQQQPIQAYVVSGEVTSAQALDRNRIKNATL
jgi:hypothetical protein